MHVRFLISEVSSTFTAYSSHNPNSVSIFSQRWIATKRNFKLTSFENIGICSWRVYSETRLHLKALYHQFRTNAYWRLIIEVMWFCFSSPLMQIYANVMTFFILTLLHINIPSHAETFLFLFSLFIWSIWLADTLLQTLSKLNFRSRIFKFSKKLVLPIILQHTWFWTHHQFNYGDGVVLSSD